MNYWLKPLQMMSGFTWLIYSHIKPRKKCLVCTGMEHPASTMHPVTSAKTKTDWCINQHFIYSSTLLLTHFRSFQGGGWSWPTELGRSQFTTPSGSATWGRMYGIWWNGQRRLHTWHNQGTKTTPPTSTTLVASKVPAKGVRLKKHLCEENNGITLWWLACMVFLQSYMKSSGQTRKLNCFGRTWSASSFECLWQGCAR